MKRALGQAPLFRILAPFGAGLIAAIFVIRPHNLFLGGIICISTGIVLFALYRFKLLNTYRLRWISGFSISLALVGLGIVNAGLHRLDTRPGFFAKKWRSGEALLVQITEPLQVREKNLRGYAEIKAIGTQGKVVPVCGNLILYFEKDSNLAYPGYGDIIQINKSIDSLSPPKNPGEFNYAGFMAYKNVYHSVYLKKNDWQKTGINTGNPIWATIYGVRSRLKSELESALPGPDEKGIAEALVYGDESDIPDEVISDYAGTGTLHILSVSGLHIGIILFGLNLLFSFLLRLKYGKYIRPLLVLTIIWAYAFLTGFSSPVARSVIMFSLVYLGTLAGRQTNIYNSICGAALILLLIDPLLVMQAGFQLSFIALTGIVWLQPAISALWQPRKKAVDWVWQLSAASISAQIVTLPLSILYFNQVSLYFLPANLIVIPYSFGVMGAGILFVFARMIPIVWLHAITAKALDLSIHGLNTLVHFINNLPGTNLQGLYTSAAGAAMLYAFIILFGLGAINKKKQLILAGLLVGVCFLIVRNIDIYNKAGINELYVLSIPKAQNVVSVKDGNKVFVLGDSDFVSDKQQMKYHINGYAWQNYISPSAIVPIKMQSAGGFRSANVFYHAPWIDIFDKKILMVSRENISTVVADTSDGRTKSDAVILSGSPVISLRELYKKYPFRHVIATAGNDPKKTIEWETECIENNIPFTNLQTDNSFNLLIL